MKTAVRLGKLKRLPCEVCGAPETDGHHDDYSKPLDVRWLCRRHHAEVHAEQRRVTGTRAGRPPRPAPTGPLVTDLRRIAKRAQRHDRETIEIRERREALVREAIAAGWPHRQIALLSGLSYQRVGQIAKETDK
jgi:hypothetical protein